MKRLFVWLFEGLFDRLTAYMGRQGFILYGGGGGGSQTSTGVTYTSNIPEYASGAFMDLVGKSQALSDAPYQPFTGQRIEGFSPLQQQSFNKAQGLAGASFVQPGMSSAYMSPYMQNVVDIQKREAMRDANIATTQRNAQAVKAGAFGGSRQAIMDAEAQRNLGTQLGDIQAQGLQSAYESGRNQYNTEFGQGLNSAQMLNTLGGQQQAQGQKQLDQQYADFQAQRDYPYQQLGFLSDILRGVSGSTRTMYSSQPRASGLQTLAGLGSLAGGLGMFRGGLVGFKEGGLVGYAEGGAVKPMALPARLRFLSDGQLQQFAQQNKDDLISMALAKSEMDARAALRQGAAPAQTPQGTVMDEVAAEMAPQEMGLAAAAPDMDFADGGIVGYAGGGDLEAQRMSDREGIAAFGRGVWEQMKRAGAAIADVGTLPARGLAGAYDTAVVRPLRAAGADLGYVSPSLVPEGADVNSMTPFYDQFRKKDAAPEYGMGNEGRRTPQPAPQGLEAALAPFEAPADPADKTRGFKETPDRVSVGASGKTSSSVAGTPRAGLTAAPAFDVDALVSPVEKRQAEADRKMLESEQQGLSDFDKDVAARGPAAEAREKRIKEQQGKLEGGERQAQKMALIQAGLSILSADPSKGAVAAIGEGALKGFGAYKGDIEKLEGKREKLLEQLDSIDELRRQEAIATGDKRRELQARIRAAEIAADQNQVKIARELRIPMTMEAAKLARQERMKLLEIEAAERNSIRQANATSGRNNAQLEIIRELTRDPALLSTYQLMNGRGNKFDMRDAYADYMSKYKPDPLNPNAKMLTPTEFGSALQLLSVPAPARPTGNATVRP